jgi:hypothetical protein
MQSKIDNPEKLRSKIEHVKPFAFCGIFDYISFRAFKYVWYSLYFRRHLLPFMETVAILKVLWPVYLCIIKAKEKLQVQYLCYQLLQYQHYNHKTLQYIII